MHHSHVDEPKIVLLDIETIPNQLEVLKHFTRLSDYPGLTLKASINSIACVGWKIFGEKKIHCINAWDFPSWKRNINDDKAICQAVLEILSDADCAVTHNGKRFDWKFLQTRILFHGLKPLPRIKHVDTCQEAKKNLLIFNNRLGTLSKFLVDDDKMENGGWDLWVKVVNRDARSLKLMESYCKKDVELLEKIFRRLKPLMTGLPNYNLWSTGKRPVCPNCQSTRLQSRGSMVTVARKYRRLQCQDCGSWSRLDAEYKNPRAI